MDALGYICIHFASIWIVHFARFFFLGVTKPSGFHGHGGLLKPWCRGRNTSVSAGGKECGCYGRHGTCLSASRSFGGIVGGRHSISNSDENGVINNSGHDMIFIYIHILIILYIYYLHIKSSKFCWTSRPGFVPSFFMVPLLAHECFCFW